MTRAPRIVFQDVSVEFATAGGQLRVVDGAAVDATSVSQFWMPA